MGTEVENIITVGDQHYIYAASSLVDDRRRVLLHGDTFAVFDRSGDLQPIGDGDYGLFHCDTRHLSTLELRINGRRPLLLSSTIRNDNALFAVDLTNPKMPNGDRSVRQGTIHIYRTKFLYASCCFECICLENYGDEPVDLTLSIHFGADFADIFEVRGGERERKGRLLDPLLQDNGIKMIYAGLDQAIRTTSLHVCGTRAEVSPGEMRSTLRLERRQTTEISITIHCASLD